ncbi:MAG: hypothetical protein V7750_19300 [Sneathiella sp.]
MCTMLIRGNLRSRRGSQLATDGLKKDVTFTVFKGHIEVKPPIPGQHCGPIVGGNGDMSKAAGHSRMQPKAKAGTNSFSRDFLIEDCYRHRSPVAGSSALAFGIDGFNTRNKPWAY